MKWRHRKIDEQHQIAETDKYIILRTENPRRYLVFFGHTTPGKSTKLLDAFDDFASAKTCAETHSETLAR